MVEAFQWYSILSIVTSSLAVGIAAFVLKRTPNRGAGNTFVTAMVFFLLASILAYLFRSGYAYYGDNEGQWLFFGRIFYFFHMLAVGYTAAFVGSYFYGFPIMRRRMVNLFLQISILVVAIVVSSLVTEAEHEVLPDGTDVGVVVENLTAVWSLA